MSNSRENVREKERERERQRERERETRKKGEKKNRVSNRQERIGDLLASRAADETMLREHQMDCRGCVVARCQTEDESHEENLEGGKEKLM